MNFSKAHAEAIYDNLYERAQNIITQHQPCEVKNENGKIICFACRTKGANIDAYAQPNTLCCRGCRHHNLQTGCTATMPLGCKLWLCGGAIKQFPEVYKKLQELKSIFFNTFGFYPLPRGDKAANIRAILNKEYNY